MLATEIEKLKRELLQEKQFAHKLEDDIRAKNFEIEDLKKKLLAEESDIKLRFSNYIGITGSKS